MRNELNDGPLTALALLGSRLVAAGSKLASIEESPLARPGEEILIFTVENVASGSATLIAMLDDVSRIHPFVAGEVCASCGILSISLRTCIGPVAAIAFKTVITLEITRRENDNRVLALHAQMCNMLSTVGL